jgi:hypothetical protein
VRDDVDQANRDLEADTNRLREEVEAQKPAEGEEGPNRPREGEEGEGQRPREDADRPGLARRAITRVARGVVNAVPELVRSCVDARRLLTDPAQSAREGLAPYTRLADNIRDLEGQVRDLRSQLRDLPPDSPDRADLQRNIDRARQQIGREQKLLELTALGTQRLDDEGNPNQRRRDADERADRARDDGTEEGVQRLRDEAETKRTEADAAQQRRDQLDEQIPRTANELETARQNAEVEARARQDAETEQGHLARHDEAAAARQQAGDLAGQQSALRTEAETLRTRAGEAERAAAIREDAATRQTAADTANQQADQTLQQMRERWGTGDRRIPVQVSDGEGGQRTSHRRVLEINDDGIVVTEGRGGRRNVPWNEVENQTMRRMGEEAQSNRQQAERDGTAAQERNTEADTIAPADADATALREQATTTDERARGMQTQIDSARGRGEVETGSTRDQHQTRLEEAQQRQERAAGSGDAVTRLQEQLAAQQAERTATGDQIRTLNTEVSDLQRRARDGESMRHQTEAVEKSSSGNAPGGVGSAYKDLLEGRFLSLLALMTGTYDDLQAMPESERPQSLGDVAQDVVQLALQPETKEQIQAIGNQQALVEELLLFTPPAEMEEMFQHRDAARQAADQYLAAHEQSFRCFVAEGAVTNMAADTETLANAGEPIVAAAQEGQRNVQEGQAEEDRRAAALAGANTETPEQDSGFASLVGDLIMEMADRGDATEGQPNAGSSGDGEQMADAQGAAGDAATEETGAAQEYSAEQRALLDQALAFGQEEEQTAQSNVDQLRTKHDEEIAIRDEITNQKNQALGERESHRATAASEATAFVDAFNELSTWAEEYKRRREQIGNAPGSSGS